MNQLLDKPAKESKLASLLREAQKEGSLQMEKVPVKGYEQVIRVTDKKTGLIGFIAIHDSSLGPALGGTRIFPYASEKDALEDALRLAKGMTYKAAVGEVGLGGGKSVIIADPKKAKTPELLLSFAAAVEKLGGVYICAEDAGFNQQDCLVVRRATKYIVGTPHAGSSGDPCPFTAWGVLRGIQSVAKKLYGTDSIEGRVVAIQGLGNVGSLIAEHLFWAGAQLILADIDNAKAETIAAKYGAKVVPADQILKTECDILVPCAMGAILNDQTIPQLRCRAVAGAANNQLHRDANATQLRDRGILYAPDFVINAGGLLNVAAELEEEGYHPAQPRYKIHHIYDTLLAIYEIAEKNSESTHAAALALAEYRLKYGIGKRTIPVTFHHTSA
jgi:leucine dehydrogenase